jgi:hypothetical protein
MLLFGTSVQPGTFVVFVTTIVLVEWMIEVDIVTDVKVFALVLKIVDVVVFGIVSTGVLKTVAGIEQIPLDVDDTFDELILLLDSEELDVELNEEWLLSVLLCVSARELVVVPLLLDLEALAKALEMERVLELENCKVLGETVELAAFCVPDVLWLPTQPEHFDEENEELEDNFELADLLLEDTEGVEDVVALGVYNKQVQAELTAPGER